jgi:hypothetical protein
MIPATILNATLDAAQSGKVDWSLGTPFAQWGIGAAAGKAADRLAQRELDDLRRTIGSTSRQRQGVMERNLQRDWLDRNDPAIRDMGRRFARTGGVVVGAQPWDVDDEGGF